MTSTSNRTAGELKLGGAPFSGRYADEQPPPHDRPAGEQPTIPGAEVAIPRSRRKTAKHRVRSRHERAGRRAGVPVKPISMSVPSTVAVAWRSYSQATRRPLVDVMLDAIVANKDRLPELVRAHQSGLRTGRQPTSDGLFLRTPAPATDTGEEPLDPFVTIPLRMLSTNVDTLDALAYESAAESRSQLVVAVLTAYLGEKAAAEAARTVAGQAEQLEIEAPAGD